jgi:hypothetical protein
MNASTEVRSKFELKGEGVIVPIDEMIGLVRGIFANTCCSGTAAWQIAEHREKTVDVGVAMPQQIWQQLQALSERLLT